MRGECQIKKKLSACFRIFYVQVCLIGSMDCTFLFFCVFFSNKGLEKYKTDVPVSDIEDCQTLYPKCSLTKTEWKPQ